MSSYEYIQYSYFISKLMFLKSEVKYQFSPHSWIKKDWPFKKVAYPGRDISSAEWELLE